jgi:hypothetical protein
LRHTRPLREKTICTLPSEKNEKVPLGQVATHTPPKREVSSGHRVHAAALLPRHSSHEGWHGAHRASVRFSTGTAFSAPVSKDPRGQISRACVRREARQVALGSVLFIWLRAHPDQMRELSRMPAIMMLEVEEQGGTASSSCSVAPRLWPS